MFQLILNPTRDWNPERLTGAKTRTPFQLILNPTRDWNGSGKHHEKGIPGSN